jgi:hypothetical protein
MGLDLWFREDVARILAAAQETMAGLVGAVPSANPRETNAYQRGFVDALRAVGVAFGVVVPTAQGQIGITRNPRVLDPEVTPLYTLADHSAGRNGGDCR